jgi:GNAT superfamily N-acetyltransferase
LVFDFLSIIVMEIIIQTASEQHEKYAVEICELIEHSAKERGTGIAKREPEYIKTKLRNQNAVIALLGEQLVGFCYIEVWSHGKYVANSGLVIAPKYRKLGLAKKLKKAAFDLSQDKYPDAKLFGITTSLPVMKINSSLGYQPVTFSELTQDEAFWAGCKSCKNYDILERNDRRMCLCTAMLAPSKNEAKIQHDLTHLIVTTTDEK